MVGFFVVVEEEGEREVDEPAEVSVPNSVVVRDSSGISDDDSDDEGTLPVVVSWAAVVGSSFDKSQYERGRQEVNKNDMINNVNIVFIYRIMRHLSTDLGDYNTISNILRLFSVQVNI